MLSSCSKNKVYDEYQALDSGSWSASESINFEVQIPEQEGVLYDWLIALRNNNDYPFSNIYFFVDVESPSGTTQRDTLQYLLAEPNGKWLGSGLGEIKHMTLQYREEQAMVSGGLYKFRISHGMRDEELFGIEDLGFRIEKSTNEL